MHGTWRSGNAISVRRHLRSRSWVRTLRSTAVPVVSTPRWPTPAHTERCRCRWVAFRATISSADTTAWSSTARGSACGHPAATARHSAPRYGRTRSKPGTDCCGCGWVIRHGPTLTTSSWPSIGATRPGARRKATTWSFACNYLHITDNLLDPSHVAWVHPGSFAGDGSDETPLQVTIADDGVTTWRWMLDTAPAPFYAPYLRFAGNCDRKQQYEVRYPSNALIKAYISPAGAGGEDKPLHPDDVRDGQLQLPDPGRRDQPPATSGSRCATSRRTTPRCPGDSPHRSAVRSRRTG